MRVGGTRRRARRAFAIVGGAVLAVLAVSVPRAEPTPRASASAFPKPDRPVAEIISPIWATERERDAVDEVGQVARLLGIGSGTNVADLGAGSGYYTSRLSRRVGPDGKVFAEEVFPRYLALLRARVAGEKLGNVTVVAGEAHDPALPTASVDVALLIHMYHEIAQPFGILHNLASALKPGARVGIVDLDGNTENHGTPPALLRCEVEAVGYRQVSFQQLKGDVGYLATFELPAGAPREPSQIKPCEGRRR